MIISRLILLLVSNLDHHTSGVSKLWSMGQNSWPLVFVNTVTIAEFSGYHKDDILPSLRYIQPDLDMDYPNILLGDVLTFLK